MGQISPALEAFYDFTPESEDFLDAITEGLSGTPKTIPCKFFYDKRGSALFDQICELDEYYVTRTETALLRTKAPEIAALMGDGCHLIEFGSGSSTKVKILLDAADHIAGYTAIDISRDHLLASTGALAHEFPDLTVTAVCADYTQPFDLPALESAPEAKPVAFFPGSSIGNFLADQARDFLAQTAALLKPRRGALLIGVDLKKDVNVLQAAYNDSRGITADFNLNLLVRANEELAADFDLAAFHHEAVYNEKEGRMEMYLVSDRSQDVRIGKKRFLFAAGETIHTENSHKYTVAEFHGMARAAGFDPVRVWTDANDLFSLHFLAAV